MALKRAKGSLKGHWRRLGNSVECPLAASRSIIAC